MTSGPIATRATFPSDYGARGGEADQLLSWDYVEERLTAAPNYWLSTVSPDAKPHARPVDGVWVDGALCFGGSDDTRWVRNLRANPALSVHLPSGDDVVILDGTVEFIDDPLDPLADAFTAAFGTKYPQYTSGDEPQPFQPFWCLRPAVVYAWTLEGFPNRATRWTFTRA